MAHHQVRSALLAGVALSLISAPALAADVPVPVVDWTGLYFSLGGGASFATSNVDATGYGGVLASGEGTYEWLLEDGGTQFGNADLDCGIGLVPCSLGFANELTIGSGISGAQPPAELSALFDELNNIANGDDEETETGVFGRIDAGFDYQITSSFVVGLNAAFNLQQISIENAVSGGGIAGLSSRSPTFDYEDLVPRGTGSLETDLELGNSWTAGVRAGFLMGERTMLFASGGYISTKAELTASYEASTDGAVSADGQSGSADVRARSSSDKWMNGYYLGAGVERLLTDHFSVKFEYQYLDLGSIDTSVDYADSFVTEEPPTAGYDAAAGVAAEANPVTHAISLMFTYRM